jgi:hypothetical protein
MASFIETRRSSAVMRSQADRGLSTSALARANGIDRRGVTSFCPTLLAVM